MPIVLDVNNQRFDIPKAVIKVAFSSVPVVGSAISEMINYFDAKYIEIRLKALEDAVIAQKILMKNFIDRLNDLDDNEHKYYVVRNNLKHLCLEALPETVDAFNKSLIDIIMSESSEMPEQISEIIRELNANDITFCKELKLFTLNPVKTCFLEKIAELEKENRSGGFRDQNRIYKHGMTVFWDDFRSFLHLGDCGKNLGDLLNIKLILNPENGDESSETIGFAYFVKSIIKLQHLGVLQCDYITTLGTSSSNYINRFHITFFGQRLLEYINVEDIELDAGDIVKL